MASAATAQKYRPESSVFGSIFSVWAGTAISFAAPMAQAAPVVRLFEPYYGSERHINPPSTVSRQHAVDPASEVTTMPSATVLVDATPDARVLAVADDWEFWAGLDTDWREAVSEIDLFSNLSDGWDGPESRAVSSETYDEAMALVRNLAGNLPNGPVPMVGVDLDGFVVLTWHNGPLAGNLSIYGNGTYAYYIRRRAEVVKQGAADISAPLSQAFVDILRT